MKTPVLALNPTILSSMMVTADGSGGSAFDAGHYQEGGSGMKFSILSTLIVTLFAVNPVQADEQRDNEYLVDIVAKEYKEKQDEYNEMARANRYRWEMVTVDELPLWCHESARKTVDGEPIWIDGYGRVLMCTDEGMFIAIRSWIDRPNEEQSQVTRLFQYRKTDQGNWRRVDMFKVTEVWDQSCGWVCSR